MGIFTKKNAIISIFIVIFLIFASYAGLAVYFLPPHKSAAIFGPKINIATNIPKGISSNATVIESVQIMSANPSYLWSAGIHANQNSTLPVQGYTTLFNATISPLSFGNGNYTSFLNYGNFSPIESGWKEYYLHNGYSIGTPGQDISMQVEVSLSILKNGSLSVYDYYNNIPFDPLLYSFISGKFISGVFLANGAGNWFNNTGINLQSYSSVLYIPAYFNVTPSFNLANPAYVAKLNTSFNNNTGTSISSPTVAPSSNNVGIKYMIMSRNVLHGPLPFVSLHNDATFKVANNYLFSFTNFAGTNTSLYMTSDQTGISSNGNITDQISTTPSWRGSYTQLSNNIQVAFPLGYPAPDQYGNVVPEKANNTSATMYISDVTFTVIHCDIYYSWEHNSQYHEKYLGNATSIVVSFVDTSNNATGTSYVPIEYYRIIQNVTAGENITHIGILNSTGAINSVSIYRKTIGYSNGSAELIALNKAYLAFPTGIGIALAYIDMMSEIHGSSGNQSESAIVNKTLGLIGFQLGLPIKLLTDFASVGFMTILGFSECGYDIQSYPHFSGYYSYNTSDYQSLNPVTFTQNGTTYSFYAPTNFIIAT